MAHVDFLPGSHLSAGLQRHPWTLVLADGTTVTEVVDGRERVYPGLFDRPDILRFSFRTPAGEIGINHATGQFFACGQVLEHPDYRAEFRGAYRHHHRVRKSFDMGIGADAGNGFVRIEHYVVGTERVRPDGSTEFLLVKFPHEVSSLVQVDVLSRFVDLNKGPGGGGEQQREKKTVGNGLIL